MSAELMERERAIIESGGMHSSTLSIPRYKIYQDPLRPQFLWVGVSVEDGPDTFFSSDSGGTWTDVASVGWEFHMSMAGNPDQYVHFVDRGTPAAVYRRLYRTSLQPEAETRFADYGENTTSGNLAVNGREVVVFTRNQDDNSDPVHFHRSTDNGETWEDGVVPGTGNDPNIRHRIGSCVIDGEIALAYWKGGRNGTTDTVTLFRWDGEAFSPLAGSFTTQTRSDWTRQYSVAQDSNGVIHLALWDEVDGKYVVRHSRRTINSDWTSPETVLSWDNEEIHPQISAFGDKTVLLYLSNPESSSSEDALVYLRMWDPAGGWGPGIRVSSGQGGGARFPVSPQQIPSNSPFIPIIWTVGEAVRFVAQPIE